MLDYTNTEKIRRLNDCFRHNLIFGGTVMLTQGVSCLKHFAQKELLDRVRLFHDFTNDNDPHREHDFGAIDQDGVRYFWKIDYYDLTKQYASPDAANPSVTHRVLTIMRADEY